LPFLVTQDSQGGKGREYGANGGAMFVYLRKLKILTTSQYDIARVAKPLTCKVWANNPNNLNE
jgi:hypothetical protein